LAGGKYICSYFATGIQSKEVLPFESVQCSKRIADGPMNMALSKKKKKSYEHTHELININQI
jgi:hypothetical protein